MLLGLAKLTAIEFQSKQRMCLADKVVRIQRHEQITHPGTMNSSSMPGWPITSRSSSRISPARKIAISSCRRASTRRTVRPSVPCIGS
jgi:hypothetical protein